MPDKPLTIATYAAGASLAAITLVYVFGPTFFLDDESSSASSRKKGVVGLANPANDCFINSVLQCLAGLPDLRIYLIRETHRRKLDGPDVYTVRPDDPDAEGMSSAHLARLEELRQGVVTQALKQFLDKLNERPIYRKTISAQAFVIALERAFRTRISRQQQDAQEFLQVVTERLCDEYHAGYKARRRAKLSVEPSYDLRITSEGETADQLDQQQQAKGVEQEQQQQQQEGAVEEDEDMEEEEDVNERFPFEGKMESQIECLTCGFQPKPTVSTFVTLTLNVPQKSSTTLNACFDGMLKVEHIDDFKCDYCRLQHAIQTKQQELERCRTEEAKKPIEEDILKLQRALEKDPENPPEGVSLPESKLAPRRRIARHMRISSFPNILAIHLSRSIYSVTSLSTKNTAKVTFPESLPLGGILDHRMYKLLGVVTHKGGHNSGHYESFRRQVSVAPYSTPHSFGMGGAYSVSGSPNPSAVQSPRLSATVPQDSNERPTSSPDPSVLPPPAIASPSTSSLSSRSSLASSRPPAPTSAPRDSSSTLQPPQPSPTPSRPKSPSVVDVARFKRKPKKRDNRWWRISDERIKECKTSDVLGMQKEVYMLFYELDR